MTTIACPGQVVGSVSTHTPGPGTHVYESNILASILGAVVTTKTTRTTVSAARSSKHGKPTVSIISNTSDNHGSLPDQSPHDTNIFNNNNNNTNGGSRKLPKVGSTILGRVLRVQQRQVNVAILLVDPPTTTITTNTNSNITLYTSTTNDDLQPQAILRREDIRAYEKDKIVTNDSFRTGDIIRALVISLGDERNYYISTAGNEYGVVVAKSVDGNALVPASWKEMKDVLTGRGESRKVAKPL